MSEMTQVGIDLDLPGTKEPSRVLGAIVRCDKLRGINPPTYEIGIFFIEMSDATRAAIDSFVEGQLNLQIEG